jgi:hypothetical protein
LALQVASLPGIDARFRRQPHRIARLDPEGLVEELCVELGDDGMKAATYRGG